MIDALFQCIGYKGDSGNMFIEEGVHISKIFTIGGFAVYMYGRGRFSMLRIKGLYIQVDLENVFIIVEHSHLMDVHIRRFRSIHV